MPHSLSTSPTSTMVPKSQRQRGCDNVPLTLDADIQALSLAKDTCEIPPAQVVFSSTSALLAVIRESLLNERDYVDLGLSCADVCQALDQGLSGRQLDELSTSVLGAIEKLTTTVAEIQRKAVGQGKRNPATRVLCAKNDKDMIATWKQDINRILNVFNMELSINNHMMLMDICRSSSGCPEDAAPRRRSTRASTLLSGELPPPPRACFGREGLIEKIVGFAENLESFALIGAGGIGKTSIALAALHNNRVKDRFGDNRRFIRCDQFPPSRAHFLSRLSKVLGTGIENPEDLSPLRPFLSSKEMILFIDNAESILDPQGANAHEIYPIIEELSHFNNICLGITSRISTVPPHCKRPNIPSLSWESACSIFYSIHDNGGPSDIVSNLVKLLDFHALSITLLATVASHNMWDYDRLAKEWEAQRVQVLRTGRNESLAATIELSLASPTFRQLSPSRKSHKPPTSPTFRKFISSPFSKSPPSIRELLETIAFFPQGINEKNLDWLFPTIPDRTNIFDKFCVLSLTYRSNGFITMLAPIREYLGPRNPKSSRLLCSMKDHYFRRLSAPVDPGKPGFEEARWIRSEDVNVEQLLDAFTSIDPGSRGVWDACIHFMRHLYWHKPRQTILRSKLEALPDGHHAKPECLFTLSRLSESVGNHSERKRFLTLCLALAKRRGDDFLVARTLMCLCSVNRALGLHREGIQQAKEALRMYEMLENVVGLTNCLNILAWSLFGDKQLDAAENVASRTINLWGEGREYSVCQSYRILGHIHHSRGERVRAVHSFKAALEIASRFKWYNELFWNHHALAELFLGEDRLDDANAHVELARSHSGEHAYILGRAMGMQARIWYRQQRLEDARCEAARALGIYEKLEAARDAECCRALLREIGQAITGGSV